MTRLVNNQRENNRFVTLYVSKNPLIRFALRRYLNAISRLVAVVADKVKLVLDAGCGEGFVTRSIHAQYPDWSIVPLDLDARCTKLVRDTIQDVEAVQGSALYLPFPDRAFDLVLANEILEHLDSPQRALDELHRVCAGYLVASVPDEPKMILANLARGAHLRRLGRTPAHVNFWSAPQFTRLLRRHGWILLRTVRCPPWVIVLGQPAKKTAS